MNLQAIKYSNEKSKRMKKQLSDVQQKELHILHDQLETIILFHIDLQIIEGFDYALKMLKHVFSIGAISAMRESFNDIVEISMELPSDQLTELNRRLKEKFGKNLFDLNKKLEKKIQAIIKREKVRNDEEYRMIKAFLDTIWDVEGKEDEVEILERLNFEYENNLKL